MNIWKRLFRPAVYGGVMLIIVVSVISYSYFIEPRWINVTERTIESPDVPPAFTGKKIVFVSDIHYGPYFSRERLTELVDKINSQQPDIILLGGDFMDTVEMVNLFGPKTGSTESQRLEEKNHYIESFAEEVGKLSAPLGKYAVLGNHDYWTYPTILTRELEEQGIHMLDNASSWITIGEDKIKIGGVGDLWESTQILSVTTRDVASEDLVLLLSHNPDYAEELKTDKIDFMFSGHLHGGQISVFGWWAPFVPSEFGQKYIEPITRSGKTTVIETNGIGMVGLPSRFWARPEISTIYLGN